MDISTKNAARIKIKDIFVNYMNGAYKNVRFFDKKQSGKSFAGHPVFKLFIHNSCTGLQQPSDHLLQQEKLQWLPCLTPCYVMFVIIKNVNK